MATQWKIIHDFKPTKVLSSEVFSFGLVLAWKPFVNGPVKVFHLPPVVSNQLPKVGEWTRIEIGHEVGEDGRYFLTFTVGGEMLGRTGLDWTREMSDVSISIGIKVEDSQPGIIRRLVVLEKH